MAVSLVLAFARGGLADEPIALGSRRELFVDRALIDSLEGASIVALRAVDRGSVLQFDRPWEGRFSGYATVIRDGDKLRLYYRGRPEAGRDGDPQEVTCYAESRDGVHWTKPDLGLFEVVGTRDNNVVLAGAAPANHNFCPFLDERPGVPEQERFKAVGGVRPDGLHAFASADGIHWRRLADEPIYNADGWVFDSQNVPFWSDLENRYVLYYRRAAGGLRSVARVTSPDFLQWSGAQPMRYSDTGSTKPLHHVYTNQTQPYFRAPQIYLATAARFLPGRQVLTPRQAERIGVHPKYFNDTSDAILLSSRGGDLYERPVSGALIRPGIGAENWVSRSNYPALNIVPTGEHEMSLYVNQNYGQPTAHLRRYTFRLDGLTGLRAPLEGGEMVTRPLTFSGERLRLNFATSAAGSVRVEIQDVSGNPLPGYTLEDCHEVIGNELEREVRWKGGESVAGLAGRPVRLRWSLRDAELYSFRFASADDLEDEAWLIDVRRVWNDAPHSAFTDLVRFRGEWYLSFREGQGHVSPDGALRVLSSKDGRSWQSRARLTSETADLRDPKLSVTPHGTLMVTAAAAVHQPAPYKHQTRVWFSEDGSEWDDGHDIGERDRWLWRTTWHEGVAYNVGYATAGERGTRLYRSDDGKTFATWVSDLFSEGYANESSLIFLPDGTALCLLRRDGEEATAQLGRAGAPYKDWSWKDLGRRIGGPKLLRLPDGRLVAGGRLYDGRTRTALLWLDPEEGKLTPFLTLPSGGDTSYPGLVYHDGYLWVSYYSSHSGKAAIYFARVKLPPA